MLPDWLQACGSHSAVRPRTESKRTHVIVHHNSSQQDSTDLLFCVSTVRTRHTTDKRFTSPVKRAALSRCSPLPHSRAVGFATVQTFGRIPATSAAPRVVLRPKPPSARGASRSRSRGRRWTAPESEAAKPLHRPETRPSTRNN